MEIKNLLFWLAVGLFGGVIGWALISMQQKPMIVYNTVPVVEQEEGLTFKAQTIERYTEQKVKEQEKWDQLALMQIESSHSVSSLGDGYFDYFEGVPCADIDGDGISDLELDPNQMGILNWDEFVNEQAENDCSCLSSFDRDKSEVNLFSIHLMLENGDLVMPTLYNLEMYCPNGRLVFLDDAIRLVGECGEDVIWLTLDDEIATLNDFDDLCEDGCDYWTGVVITSGDYIIVGTEAINVSENNICFCSDGELNEPFEECDDGNQQSWDGCNSFCQLEQPICGNGIAEQWEECGEPWLSSCKSSKYGSEVCVNCGCKSIIDKEPEFPKEVYRSK